MFDDDREFPQPETVLAIRGAIALGRKNGPVGPPGNWLNEFWHIGRAAGEAAESVAGYMAHACDCMLAITRCHLELGHTAPALRPD